MGLDSTPVARSHARGGMVVVCAVGFLARCAGRRGADGAAYPDVSAARSPLDCGGRD